jgi:hypothetical protein
MSFEPTPEHNELLKAAIEFGQSSLAGDLAGRSGEATFNRKGWDECGRFGLFGMPVPAEYGGLGLGLPAVIAVMEGLGYATRDQGLLFSINAHLWTNTIPILTYGTEEQKRKYLPPLSTGEWIGANAGTEPDAGSDIFSMRTRAARQGDCYVLNGTKTFVTNGPIADLFVAYATIDPALGSMGVTAFVVERDRPGVVVGKHLDKMGLRGSPMAEVYFNNCAIPVTQRLGREGRGVAVFECAMEWERGCILANCLGVMRRQLEQAIRHAQTRKQFGKPIGKFQSLANRVVDLKLRLETCRPLVYRIGELKQAGHNAEMESALAKLYVSECFVKSSLDLIQIFGGYGYMTEQGIEQDLRDAVGSTLYSGTSEIQRNIIAKCLGL